MLGKLSLIYFGRNTGWNTESPRENGHNAVTNDSGEYEEGGSERVVTA